MSDITLQINLSAGDINYAEQTVPPLVDAHRDNVAETLAVVDCIRPQRTRVIDPDVRFPEPEFSRRVAQISDIAEGLRSDGYFNRVFYLRPDDRLLKVMAGKYLGSSLIRVTHDWRGVAIMAYLAGLEVCNTRYLLHYDADMLLYQARGYDWTDEAITLMEKLPDVVATTPRISPPFSAETGEPDLPSLHEGRPNFPVEGGWVNDFFSARCLLIDRDRLSGFLPLLRSRVFVEWLVRKLLDRSYPMALEILIFRHVGGSGGRCLNLKSEEAWLLHPKNKSDHFIELLPQIQKAVREGRAPIEQRGYADIKLPAWEESLVGANKSWVNYEG